jgi:hypothetical protein
MRPAMLVDLVGGVHVKAVPGAQLLDQLTTKLGLLNLFPMPHFYLSQPITRATDNQII